MGTFFIKEGELYMKLKDIANMEHYLENDCYCPGEIYDVSGFFYQVFKAEEDCKLLIKGKSKKDEYDVVCVVCRDQVINFWIKNEKIVSAERYDATENNMKQMVDFWNCRIEKVALDEFNEGETKKSLEQIMKYADFVCVS